MPKKEVIQVNLAAANPNLSPATRFGNLVFVAGQTGRHPVLGEVGKGVRERPHCGCELRRGLRLRGVRNRATLAEEVEKALRGAALWDEVKDRLLDSALALSGGQMQRLCIARALATEPQYILLDEPFAGIDPIAIDDIREIILYLKRQEIGILITDHNVRETLGITDRAYIMAEGRILKSGRPNELVDDPEVRRHYLGERFSL